MSAFFRIPSARTEGRFSLLFATDAGHIWSMDAEAQSPRRPPADTVSAYIKLHRAINGWKQQLLAAKAGVSLSTVQRVERGETVGDESLEKLALALNLEPGAFTIPRVPIPEDEALASVVESLSAFADCIPVQVAPLRTEAQLRALTQTMMCMMSHDLGPEAESDVYCLREYLDLTSFSRARDGTFLGPKRERSFSIRRLYGDVLEWVRKVEARHKAVCLVGTYRAQSNLPRVGEIEVSLIVVRSREHNPAAGKIKQLMVPKTADMKAAMRTFFEEE